ncbi:MAG: metal-dependent hydrolase [Myxococcota bacterium]
MSDLEVRKFDWDFEGIPFIWNPEQPRFSVLMNQISFVIISFERYITKAMRVAEERITDSEVKTEARLFGQQEGVHAAAHQKHARALLAQYPGLQSVLDKAQASYDEQFENESLEYHLAYAGGMEAIFTPFFKMILDHREILFSAGDSRLASMLLWHFCEEIEHRSSALIVYDHVVGSYRYRFMNSRRMRNHAVSLFDMAIEEFKKHVPDVSHDVYEGNPFARVPRRATLRSALGILSSQLPWHNPTHQALPAYYDEWIGRWSGGEDVTQLYGQPPINLASPATAAAAMEDSR